MRSLQGIVFPADRTGRFDGVAIATLVRMRMVPWHGQEGRFSRGRITATRNVTVRSPMRYAPLQKRLALLTSFVIGMVHA